MALAMPRNQWRSVLRAGERVVATSAATVVLHAMFDSQGPFVVVRGRDDVALYVPPQAFDLSGGHMLLGIVAGVPVYTRPESYADADCAPLVLDVRTDDGITPPRLVFVVAPSGVAPRGVNRG